MTDPTTSALATEIVQRFRLPSFKLGKRSRSPKPKIDYRKTATFVVAFCEQVCGLKLQKYQRDFLRATLAEDIKKKSHLS